MRLGARRPTNAVAEDDPSRATTLDHLPGSPKVNAAAELEALPGISFHLLIAPVVFASLLVATVIRMA